MKGLIIKSKWADLILTGKKIIEIRGSRTNIRGKIGIIKSGSKKVYGTVELIDCVALDEELYEAWKNKHHVPYSFQALPYQKPYAWCLANANPYSNPIEYTHKQGCVIWVNL